MQLRSLPVHYYLIIMLGLITVNILMYRDILASPAPVVQALTVGKGDATFVRTREGDTLLIDTGPDASILRAVGAALPPWHRTLDAVILTSDKTAQAGGLASLKARYQIGTILRAGTRELPYGSTLSIDNLSITIEAPGIVDLSISSSTLRISSSTPPGLYPL